jgi:hypothetical protein
MNEHVVPKMTNFCVVKLSNSPAKAGPMSVAIALGRAGPMSEAIALGLTRVPRLELDHFEPQPDSPRINQRFHSFPSP